MASRAWPANPKYMLSPQEHASLLLAAAHTPTTLPRLRDTRADGALRSSMRRLHAAQPLAACWTRERLPGAQLPRRGLTRACRFFSRLFVRMSTCRLGMDSAPARARVSKAHVYASDT